MSQFDTLDHEGESLSMCNPPSSHGFFEEITAKSYIRVTQDYVIYNSYDTSDDDKILSTPYHNKKDSETTSISEQDDFVTILPQRISFTYKIDADNENDSGFEYDTKTDSWILNNNNKHSNTTKICNINNINQMVTKKTMTWRRTSLVNHSSNSSWNSSTHLD